MENYDQERDIAIVGMAGRFPGAGSVDQLWSDVIRSNREALTQVSPDGVDTEDGIGYGLLDGALLFDNEFFDLPPAGARRIDPQQRLMLEYTWKALEDAGIDIESYDGEASMYGSMSMNGGYLRDVLALAAHEGLVGGWDLKVGHDKDYVATRVGYHLNLTGECMSVQTACSSSLVGAHLARQSLITGQSDISIVGGVSVLGSTTGGEDHFSSQEGLARSMEGHCHVFSPDANGMIEGDGVGVVVLKPLGDALEDGNPIYAVLSGSAMNNDGSRKLGFTAPSADGWTDVIEQALADSDIDRDEIQFMECHGTGTKLGDDVELEALRRVFEAGDRQSPLKLGSIKANIGHLDTGAGVASLIKAALALHHREIPPLLFAGEHEPHEKLRDAKLLETPTETQSWEVGDGERRCAGVTSAGIGGTNAHAILQEAPSRETVEESSNKRPYSLLTWSAKSDQALESLTDQLADALRSRSDLDLADVAHTLQKGRADFSHRRCLAASDPTPAASELSRRNVQQIPEALRGSPGDIAFLFPGSGAYEPDMGRDLLERDLPTFRKHLDECNEYLKGTFDFDLVEFLGRDVSDDDDWWEGVSTAQPQTALVALEYALGRTLIDWGCEPDVLFSSSLGEYTAAGLSGALSMEDMLTLVYRRGELMDEITGGAMLLVDAPMSEVEKRTESGEIEEAIRVSPENVIVSGPEEDIDSLVSVLEAEGIRNHRLRLNIAMHSAAIENIREDFLELVTSLEFRKTDIPFVSTRTGKRVEFNDFSDPEYWYEQMRETVLLGDGFEKLYDSGVRLFLEVGPGQGLSKFVDDNFADEDDVVSQPTLSHRKQSRPDGLTLLDAAGVAWMCGATLDWDKLGGEGRTFVSLPTYPFERREFSIQQENFDAMSDRIPDDRAERVEVAFEILRETIEQGGVSLSDRERAPSTDAEQQAEAGGEAADEEESEGRNIDEAAITLPRNPLEEKIAEIWSDVLGTDPIGVDEDFFDLGGDSLLAARVVERIHAEVTSDLAIDEVLDYVTIRELAGYTETLLDGTAEDADEGEEARDYYCAFDLEIGGESTTIYMSEEEYEKQGVPDEAENVRFQDDEPVDEAS